MFSRIIKFRDRVIGMQASEKDLSPIQKLDFYEYSGNYGHIEAIKISIKNGSIFTPRFTNWRRWDQRSSEFALVDSHGARLIINQSQTAGLKINDKKAN